MATGNFGQVRQAYAAARQDFPVEVITYICQLAVPTQILDLGCGTGIATRQLAIQSGVTVQGCDVDAGMIAEATQISEPPITYTVAPAQQLPYPTATFDMVTVFSAFHWFTDATALQEIQRVLKPGGTLVVVNNNDVSGFRHGYKQKLEQLLHIEIHNPKAKYEPAQIVQQAGFNNVQTKKFQTQELFSLEQALQHIQSASAWNTVLPEFEQAAIALMKEHIKETMIAGQAVRNIEVVVVSGIKQ